jgi:hypothetical protein
MRYLILFLIFIFAINAIADEKMSARFHFAGGLESRLEKDQRNEMGMRSYQNFSAGALINQYRFFLERSVYKESSGNSTLAVDYQFENWAAWAQMERPDFGSFFPFVGAGIGAYQQKTETKLSNSVSLNESDWKMMGGANFGMMYSYKYFYSSVEGRFLFGDEFERQALFVLLLKLGLQGSF